MLVWKYDGTLGWIRRSYKDVDDKVLLISWFCLPDDKLLSVKVVPYNMFL
jgi:hypothetical protein